MRLVGLVNSSSEMVMWQDHIRRGCCTASLFDTELCRGFVFRFPKPKTMSKWLDVPYPRENIIFECIDGKTEELGEFEIIVFLGGSTKGGGHVTYAALIEIEGRRGVSRIGILDEGIANEVDDGRQKVWGYCFSKALDYRYAIIDGTASIDDVLFIDTSII